MATAGSGRSQRIFRLTRPIDERARGSPSGVKSLSWELRQGLGRIVVAAVGPIVAAELNAIGVQVNILLVTTRSS